jgi:dTDP-glucose 4,6-dehydratase
MYADDLVEWLMTIAANGSAECPFYNVGSREVIEVRDLAKMIGKYFGVSVQAPEITDIAIDRYIPSIEKAYLDLGLTNKYDIFESLATTVHAIKNA